MSEYSSVKREDFKIPPGFEKKIIIAVVLIAIFALIAASVGVVGAGQRGGPVPMLNVFSTQKK